MHWILKEVKARIGQGDVNSTFSFFKIQSSLFGGTLTGLIQSAIVLGGVVTTIYIIYSGFRYITSRGKNEDIESAKKGIKYALIGLVYLLVSFALVSAIRTIFNI